MSQGPGDPSAQPGRNPQSDRPRKPLFPNPFYVVLLLSSTVFVLTALFYCVSPYVVQRAIDRPGAAQGRGSLALVAWLDQNGPFTLGIEFAVMLVAGCLAMATDHWFSAKPPRNRAEP